MTWADTGISPAIHLVMQTTVTDDTVTYQLPDNAASATLQLELALARARPHMWEQPCPWHMDDMTRYFAAQGDPEQLRWYQRDYPESL